ncbi:MAG: hypothetical protein ABIG43_00930 [Chloroflexota bacterium]
MLNLKIVMRTLMILSFIDSLLMPGMYSQSTGIVLISSPRPEQTIQGTVPILGNTRTADFACTKLIFTYHQKPEAPGFLVYESPQPITNGPLKSWDTTSITDGDYDLYLRVYLTDSSSKEDTMNNLTILNDSVIQNYTQEEPLPAQQQFHNEISGTSPIKTQNKPVCQTIWPAFQSINLREVQSAEA